MRRVLRLPAYRRLLGAYALNELAWLAGSVTLAVLVYHRTGSALGSTIFFLCAQFVPALFAPLVVARIDQRSVRRVLPLLYALQCVAFVALASLATGRFVLSALLAVIVCGGTAALAARSLLRATMVAVTAPAGLLREGNALANVAVSICLLVGPALGGLVVVAGGTRTVLVSDGVLFAVITLMLLADVGLPSHVDPDATPTRWRDVLAHARERPMILSILGLQAVALVFFTISIPVEIVLAEHSLHAGADGYGALLSAWGAGAIAGSAVYARSHRHPPRRLITAGALALACGFWVMALAPTLAVALAGALVGGLGNGLEAVSARTALQEQVGQQWMAVIGSLNESMFQLMPGAGMLLGGAITTLAGARAAFGLAGTGALAVAASARSVLNRPGPGGVIEPALASARPVEPAADGPPANATAAEGDRG